MRLSRPRSPWIASLAISLLGGVAWAQPEEAEISEEAGEAEIIEIVEDEPVIITDKRPRETAGERVIEAPALSVLPRRTAEDLLRAVPGLLVVQHGAEGKGHQLYLRGFDAVHGSDVEIRVAGVPLNEWSNIHGNGYLDLGLVLPEAVTQLKAAKGVSSVAQGPFATAGSVAFELGVERPMRGARISHQIGDTGRHRLMALWAPADRPTADFVAAEAMIDGGFGARRGARRAMATGQWTLWRQGGDRLILAAAGYGARFELPGAVRLDDVEAGVIGPYDAYSAVNDGGSDRALVSLRHEALVGAGALSAELYGRWRSLRLDEHFTGWVEDPTFGDRRRQREQTWGGGGRVRLSRPLTSGLVLKLVAEGRVDEISQSERQIRTGRPDSASAGEVSEGPLRRSYALSQRHLGLGAALRWVPTADLQVEAGLRVDGFSVSARDRLDAAEGQDVAGAPLPRLSLGWGLAEGWRLLAAGGRGVRAPEGQGAISGDLAVTLVDHGEVGLRWAPWSSVEVGATGFGVWVDREALFDHVSGRTVERGASRRYGVEGELRWQPTASVEAVGDLTWTDARLVDGGGPVPGAPTFLATARLSLAPPEGLRGSLLATWLGPRPLAYGAEARAAHVIDAAVGWWASWWALDLQVQNLLDAQWYEGVYTFASWWDTSAPRRQLPTVHGIAGAPRMIRLMLTLRGE